MHQQSNRIVSGSEGGVKVWELSSGGYGTSKLDEIASMVPSSSKLGQTLGYAHGPKGVQPVFGRFIGDILTDVIGVWRTKLDSNRVVCAVQGSDSRTRMEVFDFTESPEVGTHIQAYGDGSFRTEGEPEFDPDGMEETI
jgi:F-box and WD-40 domain protein CDC4